MDQLNGVNPASFGVVVIVLLQLAQFFFAWRKDTSREASVRKEDLAAVRKELRLEIKELDVKVVVIPLEIEKKLELMRRDSLDWRDGISKKLNEIEVVGSSADSESKATLEYIKQQVASLNTKVDRLNSLNTTKR